jgi:hypothetical protein
MADNASPQPPSAAATSPNMASSAPKQSALEQFRKQYKYVQPNGKKPSPLRTPMQQPSNFHLFVKAGLPFLLFSVGASYVLKSAVEGKNLERDKSKGLISK